MKILGAACRGRNIHFQAFHIIRVSYSTHKVKRAPLGNVHFFRNQPIIGIIPVIKLVKHASRCFIVNPGCTITIPVNYLPAVRFTIHPSHKVKHTGCLQRLVFCSNGQGSSIHHRTIVKRHIRTHIVTCCRLQVRQFIIHRSRLFQGYVFIITSRKFLSRTPAKTHFLHSICPTYNLGSHLDTFSRNAYTARRQSLNKRRIRHSSFHTKMYQAILILGNARNGSAQLVARPAQCLRMRFIGKVSSSRNARISIAFTSKCIIDAVGRYNVKTPMVRIVIGSINIPILLNAFGGKIIMINQQTMCRNISIPPRFLAIFEYKPIAALCVKVAFGLCIDVACLVLIDRKQRHIFSLVDGS